MVYFKEVADKYDYAGSIVIGITRGICIICDDLKEFSIVCLLEDGRVSHQCQVNMDHNVIQDPGDVQWDYELILRQESE